MKKSLVKLAALSSAAFVLAGTVAPNVLAYTEDEYQDAWEKEMDKILKEEEKTQTPLEKAKKEAKEELAKMGVTGQLYFDQIDKAKTIQGVQNLVQEIKKAREKSDLDSYLNGDHAEEDGEADYLDEAELGYAKELAKQELKEMGVTGQLYFDQIDKAKTIQGVQNLVQEIKKARENQTTEEVPLTPLEPAEELHITEIPFDTEEDARKAAEEHLKSGKDEVNKSYKIVKNVKGKFFVELSTEEAEAPEAPEAPEAEVDGYATKEEAEAAAKKALEKDPINKSFDVRQGANGRWYYVLSPVEVEKPAEPKPEEPKPETPEKDLDTVKKEALARLDLLKALTKAEVEHFTKAILNAESANEVAAIIKEAEDVNFSVNLEAETPAKEVKPEESKEGSKKEEKKEDKKEKLPETGEVSSFAIFGGAALSVLAGLGLVASKKEEN